MSKIGMLICPSERFFLASIFELSHVTFNADFFIYSYIYVFLCLFQFLNTRSHKDKGEKDKGHEQDSASDADVEEPNLSLMDRTKRQAKAAKVQGKRVAEPFASPEDEVTDLEEVVIQTRERIQAAKAAKARAAALRQELLLLQEEEESIAGDHNVVAPAPPPFSVAPAPPPVSAPFPDPSDPGAFIAATLKSAVIIFSF